jgi:predicted ATPase/DNA-binding SARP family transcriptional activator
MTTVPEMDADVAPAAVAHNVPTALSSFVGRTQEVAGLTTALSAHRLVTLVGAGGAGKTRLAREVAVGFADVERVGARFSDGVWWVELAPLRDGADVAAALAAVLGISPSPGRRLADALTDALRPQQALLVFDNCEHVIEDVARLADDLLRRAPGLTMLATSREALSIDGEAAWPVSPLSRPDTNHVDAAPLRAADAVTYDAVRLFVDRTRAVTPGFQLTDGNAATIATICARLDGLPLALELAAAVVPVVGLDGLASRLDNSLALLTRGKRTALPRHRTLRAVLDWSYALLADAERTLLRRMSVFCGPVTLDAIEQVCAEPARDIIATLGRLVEHSLVDVREDHGESRYRLLETVRQYASALLQESPDHAAARERHARWVTAMAVASEPALFGPARGRTVERLRQSIDEIRAALSWATGPGGSPMLAVHLSGALGWFWISGLPWEEARSLLAVTLAAADAEQIPDTARPVEDRIALGQLQYPIIGLAYFAGDTVTMLSAAARDLAIWDSVDRVESLSDAQRLTAARGRTLSLQLTGIARAMLGEADRAVQSMDACIDVARASDDEWLLAVMMMRRALVHFLIGDHAAAQRDYDASVPVLRQMHEWWFLSLALEGMAANALAVGDATAAIQYARESIIVLRPEPDAWFISRSLDTMAHVFVSQTQGATARQEGPIRLAARLLGAAEALRRRCGAGVIGPDLERNDRMYTTVREWLGDATFDDERTGGATWSVADIFARMDDDPLLADTTDRAAPPAADRTLVTLQVLGPFQLIRDGRVMTAEATPVGKVRELLLFLVLHEHVTKEDVGLALWPDASPAQVRNAFHVTLHHLRRILGPEQWIVFDRNGYRLDRAPAGDVVMDVDVDAVLAWSARLRQASRRQQLLEPSELALARTAFDRSRGDLAQNVVAEDWLVVHQDRLRTAWADGMDALAAQYQSRAQFQEVVAVCEQLVAREPLREGAHRLLMQALASLGEPARALAHFDSLTDLLQREVGARPAAETRALAEQIRR